MKDELEDTSLIVSVHYTSDFDTRVVTNFSLVSV